MAERGSDDTAKSQPWEEQLLAHIRAAGPITLFDMLGWLTEQSPLSTAEQVRTWATLHQSGQIAIYGDADDIADVSYVAV
jgi:hypothetical protein